MSDEKRGATGAGMILVMKRDYDALVAERDALRAALKPFAEARGEVTQEWFDSCLYVWNGDKDFKALSVTTDDLQAAKAALGDGREGAG